MQQRGYASPRRLIALVGVLLFAITGMAPSVLGEKKQPRLDPSVLRERAVKLVEGYARLVQDSEKNAEQLASGWAAQFPDYVAFQELGRRIIEAEKDAEARKAARSGKGGVRGPKGGKGQPVPKWIKAHGELLRNLAGSPGMTLARWKGTLNARRSDLDKMVKATPKYIAGYKAILELADAALDRIFPLISSASFTTNLRMPELMIRTNRAMLANFQKTLYRHRNRIQEFLQQGKPDALDAELDTALKPLLNDEMASGLQPDFRLLVSGLVAHLERDMLAYEDLYDKARDAQRPLLDGSAFKDVAAFGHRKLSKYMEPFDRAQAELLARRTILQANEILLEAVRASRRNALAQEKVFLEVYKVYPTGAYEEIARLLDVLEASPQVRTLREKLNAVSPSASKSLVQKMVDRGVREAGRRYDKLLAALSAAGARESDIRRQFQQIQDERARELKSLQKKHAVLVYDLKVLRERALRVAQEQADAKRRGAGK